MATTDRFRSRRQQHQRRDSLSTFNAEYDARNVRYSASPTPGNSASKHHRRNSMNRQNMSNAAVLAAFKMPSMNIKFQDSSMQKSSSPAPPRSHDNHSKNSNSNKSKHYTISATQHTSSKPPPPPKPRPRPHLHVSPSSAATRCAPPAIQIAPEHKEREEESVEEEQKHSNEQSLHRRELRLMLRETEFAQNKAKHTVHAQELLHEVNRLKLALEKERGEHGKHKLSTTELSELDAVRRENSKLRATVNRMKDELQYMEMAQYTATANMPAAVTAAGTTGTTHNNYYIHAFNYNNIINHHSTTSVHNSSYKWYPLTSSLGSLHDQDGTGAPNNNNGSSSSSSTRELGEVPIVPDSIRHQSSTGSNSNPSTIRTHRSSIFGLHSIGLHELEKKCNRKQQRLDVREQELDRNWSQYREKKERLRLDEQELDSGRRELERNHRRLRMQLNALQIFKQNAILEKAPKLFAMHYSPLPAAGSTTAAATQSEQQQMVRLQGLLREHRTQSKFSDLQLTSIKHSISDAYQQRQTRMTTLQREYHQFVRSIDDIQDSFKQWMREQHANTEKHSQRVLHVIEGYTEHKKKNNGMLRRFDTKQFDPLEIKHTLRRYAPFADDDEEEEEAEEAEDADMMASAGNRHVPSFSFERNASFDYIADLSENNVATQPQAEQAEHEQQQQTLSRTPKFERKRTHSYTVTDDEMTLLSPNPASAPHPQPPPPPPSTIARSTFSLSPQPPDDEQSNASASMKHLMPSENSNTILFPQSPKSPQTMETPTADEHDDEEEAHMRRSTVLGIKNSMHSKQLTLIQNEAKDSAAQESTFGDADLLHIITQNQQENDALRLELSELKCDNFNLHSKHEYLQYEKQLLLDQMEELGEVNAELKHNVVELTEFCRDDGLLREELLAKDLEISSKEDELAALHDLHRTLESDFSALTNVYAAMKAENKAFMRSLQAYKEYVKQYLIEYLWTECQVLNAVESVWDQLHAATHKGAATTTTTTQELIQKIEDIQLQKTIEINDDGETSTNRKKRKQTAAASTMDADMLSFESKSKLHAFITNLHILPSFEHHDASQTARLLREELHQNGMVSARPASEIIGRNALYASVQLPPILTKLQRMFAKLLTKIVEKGGAPSATGGGAGVSARHELQLSKCRTQCVALDARVEVLQTELHEARQQKDEIYFLFSKYKKERSSLLREIGSYQQSDVEHRKIAEMLAQSQDELDSLQRQFDAFRKQKELEVGELHQSISHHKKSSSITIAKQKLDSLMNVSQQIQMELAKDLQNIHIDAMANELSGESFVGEETDEDEDDDEDEDGDAPLIQRQRSKNIGLTRTNSARRSSRYHSVSEASNAEHSELYYGGDTGKFSNLGYDDSTVFISSEMYDELQQQQKEDVDPTQQPQRKRKKKKQEHEKSSSMVINEAINQDSSIRDAHLSKDFLPDVITQINRMSTMDSVASNDTNIYDEPFDDDDDDDDDDGGIAFGDELGDMAGLERMPTTIRTVSTASQASQASQTTYGYDAAVLSPMAGYDEDEKPDFKFAAGKGTMASSEEHEIIYKADTQNKSRQEQSLLQFANADTGTGKHLPRDSFYALSENTKQQITAHLGGAATAVVGKKKHAMNVIDEYSLHDENAHGDSPSVPRQNTVDRMIDEHDRRLSESPTAHIPISEQQTRIIAPGSSALLPQLDDTEDAAMRTAIKKRFDLTYQEIMTESAKQVNSSIHYDEGDLKLINMNGRMQSADTEAEADGDRDDDDDDDDDDDHNGPPDIYGQYGVQAQAQTHSPYGKHNHSSSHPSDEMQHNRNKSSVSSRHSTGSSMNSDGYLDLSDTLKVSKEQFAAALHAQNYQQMQMASKHNSKPQLNEINEHTSVQFSGAQLTQLQHEMADKEESPTPSTTVTITPSDAQYHSDASQSTHKPIIHKRRNESFDVMANIIQAQTPHREDVDDSLAPQGTGTKTSPARPPTASPEVHRRNATTVVHVEQLKNAAAAQQSEPEDASDTESVEMLHGPNFGGAKERDSQPYEEISASPVDPSLAAYPSGMQTSFNSENALHDVGPAVVRMKKANSIISEHGTHYITYNDSNHKPNNQ